MNDDPPIDQPLAILGDPDQPLDFMAMVNAQMRMRVLGVDFDALVYELTTKQAIAAESVLIPDRDESGRMTIMFRGVQVCVKDGAAQGRIICPPTPYNDATGATGRFVEIRSR